MFATHPRATLAAAFLAACVAAGTSLLATPASSAAPVIRGASQTAARRGIAASGGVAHPVAPSLATRQLPLLKVANRILERTGQGAVAGYSGYGDVTISVARHQVTLYWHGHLPAPLRRWLPTLRAVAPVRVLSAAYTWQQLEMQARQIARAEPALDAGGYVIPGPGGLTAAACSWAWTTHAPVRSLQPPGPEPGTRGPRRCGPPYGGWCPAWPRSPSPRPRWPRRREPATLTIPRGGVDRASSGTAMKIARPDSRWYPARPNTWSPPGTVAASTPYGRPVTSGGRARRSGPRPSVSPAVTRISSRSAALSPISTMAAGTALGTQ